MTMAKVLVTGASGFIGTHLVAALAARGEEITCFVRKTSKVDRLQALGGRLVYGDVTDPESLLAAVAGHQIVYHLAGCTRARHRRQFFEVNCRGVAHVAQACAAQDRPPVLIHVSSQAAAGPAVGGRPRVESDPASPVSQYGRTKRLGECAAERLAHQVPITIVRPPMVVGEGDRLGLSLFRSVVRFHVHLTPGIGPRRFSLIHADDLVQLLILAAERGRRLPPRDGQSHPVSQGYYFAACEQDPTYADLGRLVAESVGRRVLVIPTAMPVVRMLAAMGEMVSHVRHNPPVINLDKAREIAAGSWLCSAQTAREELGFAVGAPLIERLRQTTEWYCREGWL
jgi:nucleoside-diphosphate-sugar epimerase